MKRIEALIILAAALAFASCATKDENTLVGSEYVATRLWSLPVVSDGAAVVSGATYFEASAFPGTQDDLLLGDRRKFRFETAVYFTALPAKEDSLISARLTASPWYAGGAGVVRVDRALENWSESSNFDTLGRTPGEEASFGPDLDAEIPLDWVRSWIDSIGGNHGLILQPATGDSFYLRIPSREARDDADEPEAGAFRLQVTFADSSAGRESTSVIVPALDRFYAYKVDSSSDIVDHLEAETLFVGVRETMTNQAIFEFELPEELSDVTVNQFELVLTVAGAALETELELTARLVSNDSLTSDSITVGTSTIGLGSVPPDVAPGDTVTVDFTSIARSWWAVGEWSPRVLIRGIVDLARDRYVSFYSTGAEGAPRVRLLYTPLRPDEGEAQP